MNILQGHPDSAQSNARDALIASYDRLLFDDHQHAGVAVEQGYANLGYWATGADTPAAAARALAQKVLGCFSDTQGPVLDVGCGLGATTAVVAEHFGVASVTGINISSRQLQACRQRLPKARFMLMQAESLDFPARSYAAVLSIEAALHFQGRAAFLAEAHRVLQPGGEIVVADILFHRQPTAFPGVMGTQELYGSVANYTNIWRTSGFSDIETIEVTDAVWRGFIDFRMRQVTRALALGQIEGARYLQARRFIDLLAELPVMAYTITRAMKARA